jgi:hypothetical protein
MLDWANGDVPMLAVAVFSTDGLRRAARTATLSSGSSPTHAPCCGDGSPPDCLRHRLVKEPAIERRYASGKMDQLPHWRTNWCGRMDVIPRSAQRASSRKDATRRSSHRNGDSSIGHGGIGQSRATGRYLAP